MNGDDGVGLLAAALSAEVGIAVVEAHRFRVLLEEALGQVQVQRGHRGASVAHHVDPDGPLHRLADVESRIGGLPSLGDGDAFGRQPRLLGRIVRGDGQHFDLDFRGAHADAGAPSTGRSGQAHRAHHRDFRDAQAALLLREDGVALFEHPVGPALADGGGGAVLAQGDDQGAGDFGRRGQVAIDLHAVGVEQAAGQYGLRLHAHRVGGGVGLEEDHGFNGVAHAGVQRNDLQAQGRALLAAEAQRRDVQPAALLGAQVDLVFDPLADLAVDAAELGGGVRADHLESVLQPAHVDFLTLAGAFRA